MARVITLTSGSAGVGKTIVCVNLAAQLARRGKRVCLVDTGGGEVNASVALGLEPRHTLRHLSHPGARLDDVLIRDCSGFDVLASACGDEWIAALPPAQLHRLLDALIQLDAYDFVLIDSTTATAAHTPVFAQFGAELVLVITPEPVSPREAYSLLSTLSSQYPEKRIHVIVNKYNNHIVGRYSYDSFKEIGGLYLGMQLALLGVIGETGPIPQALPRQQETMPGTFVRSIGTLADQLLTEKATLPEQTMQSFCARYQGAVEAGCAAEQAVVEVLEMPVGRKQKLQREVEYLSKQVDDLIKEIERLRRAPQEVDRTTPESCTDTPLSGLASDAQSVTLQGETFSIYSMQRSNGSRQYFAWHSLDDCLETSASLPGSGRGEQRQ